ncbi:AAA family ATPase [Avibacterium sp. 20-126]|uniref:ATP-dependent nuclease n=1 Tax=Avibacterium sp. 20-126 TaxID=2911524 RepID=UPI002189FFAC|nr:AAA family ATPase [Avibacterium sp. 20-126]
MKFPLSITANINSHGGDFTREVELRSPLTFIVGPNGSGKTHLLKGLKNSFSNHTKKKVRFISAGRLGPMEKYRSNYDQYDRRNDADSTTHGNKYDLQYRHKIETITGDFYTLSARSDILIKVKERLQKLFKRNISIDWDAGELKVSFAKLGKGNSYYSSGREASGLLHLVGILSAMYDDEVGVLLIDEPEVSLHPQLQAFLLKEISRVSGIPSENGYKKIIIMATHSTEMIKISKTDDLLSFIFCNDLKEDPIQIPNNAGELQNKSVKGLIARLGQEHKLTLFSKTPLLVEGPSDVIICNAIADRLYLNLEASGSQILPINGKQAMPETIKLLRLMGKEPTVLFDSDAFADGLELVTAYFNHEVMRDETNQLVSRHGHKDILSWSKQVYDNFCQSVKDDWNSICEQVTVPSFCSSDDEEKNKRRVVLCTLFNNNQFERKWELIKNQLNTLFEVFEQCGLFILKKGTIESYYITPTENFDLEKKVDKSVEESEAITTFSEEQIYSAYQDVIDCLKFASCSEEIDESRAIRDELLSFVSPIHARYAEGADLDMISSSASIFTYQINETGKLKISMSSNVLDAKGFPIILDKNDDVRKVVNNRLGIE